MLYCNNLLYSINWLINSLTPKQAKMFNTSTQLAESWVMSWKPQTIKNRNEQKI